ncbi:MAG TPA: metallophosphoesterase family protein [Acidimicrobiia bacterium]|nr:metallophosphoesterase family protein [Acidimicrobiia bacterium]
MLLVSDVHGAFDSLARVAASGETLLVLGDLLNFVDYRTMEGMLTEVAGKEFVTRLAGLRTRGDQSGARDLWARFSEGREAEVRERYDRLTRDAYRRAAAALAGSGAYVTYGNVDRPDVLQEMLSTDVTFVEAGAFEIEGVSVGIVGGGVPSLGVSGEVGHDAMAARLGALGPVEMLCTHVAPAVSPLSSDVIGGRPKQSVPVLEYLREHRPRWHYFGDIHQPQATTWRVGETVCRNVGYFRATGRPVRHG